MSGFLSHEWWSQLDIGEQVFWGIAIVSTVLFVIQLVLTFVGMDFGDADVDLEGSGDLDEGAGMDHELTIFSIRSIIAFFTFLGWGGLLVLSSGLSLVLAIVVGIVIGVIAMYFVAWALFKFAKMTEIGTVVISGAVGEIGEVYLPIPPNREGYGQVHVHFDHTFKELNAITDGAKISTGKKVEIMEVLSENVLLVKEAEL